MPCELVDTLDEVLKKDLWVVEISLPELFPANKRKLGEIILDPYSKEKSLKSFKFARILNKLYFMDHSKALGISVPNYDVAEIDTHTKLYPEK